MFASPTLMRHLLVPILVVVLASVACSSTTSPITPTPAPLSLSGTWTGDLSVLGTLTRTTWTISQTNNSVTGSALVLLPSGVVLLNGQFAGTLAGSVLTYTITVPPGGIPTNPGCTGQLAGSVTANVSAVSTLAGSYTVASSTCPTPFSSGNFTLTKQ